MKYKGIAKIEGRKFRRLTGVKRETFEKMVEILSMADRVTKKRGGRKNTLSVEERLLMALEYIREYRTYFHISQSYGVSESTAYKTVKWVEDTLIKSPDFSLPGRKELLNSEVYCDVVLVDATETPIDRPKKRNDDIIQARKNDIR